MKGKNMKAKATLDFIEATDNKRSATEIANIAAICPVDTIIAQISYLFVTDSQYAIWLIAEIEPIRSAIMDNISLVASSELLDYLSNGTIPVSLPAPVVEKIIEPKSEPEVSIEEPEIFEELDNSELMEFQEFEVPLDEQRDDIYEFFEY